MSTETHEESPRQYLRCYWPEKFTKRRNFNPRTENEPYIDYLQTQLFSGEENEHDDLSNENDEDDVSNEPEEEVEGGQDENHGCDKNAETCSGHSNVRLFMTGMEGDEDALENHDQVDVVASFCEQASLREPETKPGQDRKCVALLDDRDFDGTIVDKKGHCRPDSGPLTSQQLLEKLSRKRFRVESEEDPPTNGFEDEESDAGRRVVFVTNPDSSTVEAVATTASLTQALALQDFFYKYLTGQTSIGVTIRSIGFSIFTLDLHIPYYVLRFSGDLLKDTRKKSDGEPLRQSWELPFLSRPINPLPSVDGLYCLYEAQISITITGIDYRVWAAYGFIDNYFGSSETVEGYHKMKGRFRGRADPLAAGQLNADDPIWGPREYFFEVFDIRIKRVLKEWNWIVHIMEKDIKRSRMNHVFPQLSSEEVRDFSMWNTQMVTLLTQLAGGLSETVEAWEEFRRTEIGYFLYDEKPLAVSSSIKPSVASVNKTFSKLRLRLRKLEDLGKELDPQGPNAHPGTENNEAAISQRRTARHIEILTVITILFFPLGLAANLFSTTGVLPFTPNLVKFIYALLVLGVAIVATLVVLYNWRSWLHQMVEYAQMGITYYNECFGGGGIRRNARIISQKALKRKIFPRRPRKTDLPKRWDIEKGTKKAKAG